MIKCGHVSPPGEGTDMTRPLLQTTDFACLCQQWAHPEELALECYSWAAPGGQSPPSITGYCMGCWPPWVLTTPRGIITVCSAGGVSFPQGCQRERDTAFITWSAHMEGTANTISHTLTAVRPFSAHPPLPVQFALMGQRQARQIWLGETGCCCTLHHVSF